MKSLLLVLAVVYAVKAQEYSTTPGFDDDLRDEAYALLYDVKGAVELQQNKSIQEINEYTESIQSEYQSVNKTLNGKRKLIEEIDNKTTNCQIQGYDITICNWLLKEAVDGSGRIDLKWKVCEHTYIDNLEKSASGAVIDVKNASIIFSTFENQISNCGKDEECLLDVISDLVKERRIVLKKINELTSNFISKQESTLNNAINCVFDGTTSFIAEHNSISKIYCDCTYAAYENQY
ncbi:uncharacterized protein LOC126265920 [Aethina tumida]|uniref:uncharacterized protein LOC126265920 n=1 Tax=Aethina tumida TaxID=116153 RepID=UPI002148D3BE|nr:uncharacterized protein LOC126265920 [Aethina tumida]